MRLPAPHTLSADGVDALTAYILDLNAIVAGDVVADRETSPKVKMPNHDNFIWHEPRPDTITRPCMNACLSPADTRSPVHGGGDDSRAANGWTARYDATDMKPQGSPLIENRTSTPALILALALAATVTGIVLPVRAQSAAAEGQKIAFDRSKGNCLTCHDIKGGDLPGSIGPKLENIKAKYPDRNDLVAILTDETTRNPQTVMPPFGRNRILTEREINAVVDFLQTL